MTIFKTTLVTAVTALLVVGCSSSSRYAVQNESEDEYVYILDYEKIAFIEKATQYSNSNLDMIWVNPPVKRIKRSELEALQAKQ
ncbi:hypothetical protein [Kangiella marina]|uniref:Lipoprotein n=1 Tax=Kangiella marina TaxID=1079178 RepID=A0ABP8INK8_9GAMM